MTEVVSAWLKGLTVTRRVEREAAEREKEREREREPKEKKRLG